MLLSLVLLVNGNSLPGSWTLHSTTDTAPCSPTIRSDNTYTFFADGTFEFNHGAVTEDPQCQNDNCCSDLLNLVGTWKLTDNESKIVITADHEKENPNNKFSFVLFDATVVLLSETTLQLSQMDAETNTNITIEFRKK